MTELCVCACIASGEPRRIIMQERVRGGDDNAIEAHTHKHNTVGDFYWYSTLLQPQRVIADTLGWSRWSIRVLLPSLHPSSSRDWNGALCLVIKTM